MTTFRSKLMGANQSGRTVEVPAFFAEAMTKAERKSFDALPYSHRKEYVDWLVTAKKPETRARRVEKAREKLRPGPCVSVRRR
jgi:uncharacterized protein YdeI (YjbR/CyaY-like superfamily)